MKAPIIVNDSSDMNYSNIDVFASIHDAELYHEPWYVDEPYFAYDADGLRLEMLPDEKNYKVILRPLEKVPSGKAVLIKNLRDDLKRLAENKGWDFVGVTPEWLEQATLEGLLEVHLKWPTR